MKNGIGISIEDLRWNYTMDQIYLMNTKLCRKDMDSLKDKAILLSNALVYASVSYDKDSVRKKQMSWDKFVKSLDWRKLSGQPGQVQKKSSQAFARDLGRLKVGVK